MPEIPVISRIPLANLRHIEAEICRAQNRDKWWKGANNSIGAVGRMIDKVLELRGAAAEEGAAANDSQCTRLTQSRLLKAIYEHDQKLTSATLTQFLNGQANTGGKRQWYKLSRAILHMILEGVNSPRAPTPQEVEIAGRICQFFFPQNCVRTGTLPDRNRAWYFHPLLKRLSMPATHAEAAAELRAIAYYCSSAAPSKGRGVVVRTSGAPSFLHVGATGELTEVGCATLECLQKGVEVFFVYPTIEPRTNTQTSTPGPDASTSPRKTKPMTEAETSALAFKAIAEADLKVPVDAIANLHLQGIDPSLLCTVGGRTLWAGEYLSRSLRYGFQRCTPTSPNANFEPWSMLLISREEKYGICAYQTDDNDLHLFNQWLKDFLPLAGENPPASTSQQTQVDSLLKLNPPGLTKILEPTKTSHRIMRRPKAPRTNVARG